ncbi:hypothetical protein Tco_0263601 [Tanacetum coccineum]
MFKRKSKRSVRVEEEEDDTFPVYSHQSQEDMNAIVSALSQVIGSDETTIQHGDMSSYSSTSSNTPNQPPPSIQQSPGWSSCVFILFKYLACHASLI